MDSVVQYKIRFKRLLCNLNSTPPSLARENKSPKRICKKGHHSKTIAQDISTTQHDTSTLKSNDKNKHNTTKGMDSEGTPVKKKKKWKSLPLTDVGFKMSLFPRPTRPEIFDPDEEERILRTIERDLESYEATVEKYRDLDATHTELFEGNVSKKDKLSRKDKHRRVRKAGKQVKDKYCYNLKNNKGRKRLFIHHRLYKLINLEEKRVYLHLPSNSKYRESNLINRDNRNNSETKSRLNVHVKPPGKPQNLRHALAQNNAAGDISTDLVSVLINLQHRELTPEDYEVLLRLDESVAPKTIDKSTLDNFKTDTVTVDVAGDVCAVCLDVYELGQIRKFLPCNHVFHASCIDMWLENSSRNCPIDGLPIDERS
ncbi:RNF44-like protein [Mya arenaria]|uniref:RNF44-like protein n=1 Tax=Mya arenaria TaxID=6604 RepID=A0ABY7GD66_MYAAR|nr:RNF44-like protein [Mya arenaria]